MSVDHPACLSVRSLIANPHVRVSVHALLAWFVSDNLVEDCSLQGNLCLFLRPPCRRAPQKRSMSSADQAQAGPPQSQAQSAPAHSGWHHVRGILSGSASGITKLVIGHPFGRCSCWHAFFCLCVLLDRSSRMAVVVCSDIFIRCFGKIRSRCACRQRASPGASRARLTAS